MATIVVLDSEKTVRTVVTNILQSAGHRVLAFEDLGEALPEVRNVNADLILTNVYLRDTTGHGALKTLRGELPNVPVLMVSGLPDEDVIQQWRDEAGFDVFPKPFTAASLLTKVSLMLKH